MEDAAGFENLVAFGAAGAAGSVLRVVDVAAAAAGAEALAPDGGGDGFEPAEPAEEEGKAFAEDRGAYAGSVAEGSPAGADDFGVAAEGSFETGVHGDVG